MQAPVIAPPPDPVPVPVAGGAATVLVAATLEVAKVVGWGAAGVSVGATGVAAGAEGEGATVTKTPPGL